MVRLELKPERWGQTPPLSSIRNPRFGFSHKPMPSKCPDCGGKMSGVVHDNKHWWDLWGSASSPRSYRECACGCLIVWGYPNHFYRRHILPLFDTINEVLGEA